MSEYNADAGKLKVEPNTSAQFNAISPLEPLDPNKFRNIMLEKTDIPPNQPNHNLKLQAMAQPAPNLQTGQILQDSKQYATQSTSFLQNQSVANATNSAAFVPPTMQPQPHNLRQSNLSMFPQHQQQQYYASQQSLHAMSSQYGMLYPGLPTPMMPMQQQRGYIVQGQQWIPPQQCHQNVQAYHQQNFQQNRICAQQPQTSKQILHQPTEIIQYPTQNTVVSHPMQRQPSQDLNYNTNTIQPQTPQPHQQIPPQFNQPANYIPFGYRMEAQQQAYQNQGPDILQSTQPKRSQLSNPPEQIRQPQQQMPNTEYERNLTNSSLMPQQRPQALRMPVPIQHHFIGHEPKVAATINPDICLAGCVFLLVEDYDAQQVDGSLLPTVIRFYGGDTESNNPRGIPERVTHVVCSSWLDNETLIQQALTPTYMDRMARKMKRIVTVNWINDAIEKRRVDPPSKASHLPSFWSDQKKNPQLSTKVISIAGFDKPDAVSIKTMIQAVGARFCPLTSKTDLLIINKKSTPEEIVQKARAHNISMVNYKWLFELYFGNVSVLAALDDQSFSPDCENLPCDVNISPQYLAKMSEFCHKLMLAWTQPIQISEDIIKAAFELKRNIANDTNIFSEKLYSISDNAPSEMQIKQTCSLRLAYVGKPINVVVLIEGLIPEQIENLSKKVRFLGGRVSDTIEDCTHFVVTNLRRSINLIGAIARGKSIVSPTWIETSFKHLEFVDPIAFFVKDRENERKFGYNLKMTILRARQRKIFQDVSFHISANVQPSFDIIKYLIESAGGEVEAGKPLKKQLLQYIRENKTYFIICNKNDINFYQYLVACNFPLFSEDFVIMSILRHKIDLSDEFQIYPSMPHSISTGIYKR